MKLWGGRFNSQLDPKAFALNASLPFDQRLALQDVQGSLAWAQALERAQVLTRAEAAQIQSGLEKIAAEFKSGTFAFIESDEDIHTAVERRLGEWIGALAGKLHTGRSRNDQVATDFRLWTLETLPVMDEAIRGLQAALLARAAQDMDILMPGYTHVQRAQPVLLSHWWLSHFWALQRDRDRLVDLRARVAVLPLGCGALAGSAFPVDRAALAAALGFDAPAPNSMDAVSDRDFAAEYLFCAAMTGVHLSKLAEAVILFTTAEFGFFELSDAFSTGSSLMPQKKNPDLFELARGKSGTLIGLLTGMLSTLKGLPSAYDKDLQEDKEPVFQATDTLLAVLPALAGAVGTLAVNKASMLASLDASMLATDLADFLVRKGLPFREAHGIIGKAVRVAAEKCVGLNELSLQEWQVLGPFGIEVFDLFDPRKSVEQRNGIGGTSPQAVRNQLEQAKSSLASRRSLNNQRT